MFPNHENHPAESDPRGPFFDTDDEFRLGGRLTYVFMLLRRGDAGRRPGARRASTFQGQGRVLRILALNSPVSQKELAYMLGIRSQSLAELLAKLEASGLVTRHPDPSDGRTKLVELTEEGRESIQSEAQIPDQDPFSVLNDEEKKQFAEYLDRITEKIEGDLPDGSHPRMQKFKQRVLNPEEDSEGRSFGPGRGRGRGGFGGPRGPRGGGRGDRGRGGDEF